MHACGRKQKIVKNHVHSHFPVFDSLCAIAKLVVDLYSVASCPGHVSLMPRPRQSHAQVTSVSCPGHVSLMPRSWQSHAQVMAVSCPGHVSRMPRPTGHIRRKYASHLVAGYEGYSSVVKNVSFHEHSQTLKTLSVTNPSVMV